MSDRLEHCRVRSDARLIDVLRSLDLSGVEIALVMEGKGRLSGIMTDGDVRRALLSGATLDSRLASYVQRNFTVVPPTAGRAEVLDLMQARMLEQIPVVDNEGELVGLHLLHDLIGTVERSNWAVIMAGGKGTRLRPMTENVPKPMITVAGRPILERLILHLVSCGIRRVFLSINYLGHVVEGHFGDGTRFGCRIEYLREPMPLGTGGALSLLPVLPTAPLLVLNGDVMTQADFGSLLDFHAAGSFKASIGVREYTHIVPFGCVTAEGHHIVQFHEKPMLTRLVNTGIYVLAPELLERVPRDTDFPITNLFDECLRRGEALGAYPIQDEWIDVGQREQLKMAREGVE